MEEFDCGQTGIWRNEKLVKMVMTEQWEDNKLTWIKFTGN